MSIAQILSPVHSAPIADTSQTSHNVFLNLGKYEALQKGHLICGLPRYNGTNVREQITNGLCSS